MSTKFEKLLATTGQESYAKRSGRVAEQVIAEAKNLENSLFASLSRAKGNFEDLLDLGRTSEDSLKPEVPNNIEEYVVKLHKYKLEIVKRQEAYDTQMKIIRELFTEEELPESMFKGVTREEEF